MTERMTEAKLRKAERVYAASVRVLDSPSAADVLVLIAEVRRLRALIVGSIPGNGLACHLDDLDVEAQKIREEGGS
jgi:hypothetical protein